MRTTELTTDTREDEVAFKRGVGLSRRSLSEDELDTLRSLLHRVSRQLTDTATATDYRRVLDNVDDLLDDYENHLAAGLV